MADDATSASEATAEKVGQKLFGKDFDLSTATKSQLTKIADDLPVEEGGSTGILGQIEHFGSDIAQPFEELYDRSPAHALIDSGDKAAPKKKDDKAKKKESVPQSLTQLAD